MKAIFNKEIIDDQILNLNADDRAIQYGDGLFETIIVGKNRINLLDYHYARLIKGAKVLGLVRPDYFTLSYLEARISELTSLNHIAGAARIKVQFWRSSGGFYEPLTNKCNILITIRPHSPIKKYLKNVGIAQSVKNYPSPFSQFKSISALKYVLASIEKQNSGYDDLIILDHHGNISELLYSNIFWFERDILYTPSLNTGCIRGVMRSYLIDRLVQKDTEILEIEVQADRLLQAEYIFATNAAGIIPIVKVLDNTFTAYPDIEQLIE